MNRGRAVVGLCMFCALLGSAFAAQSASAVTKGTTAFTCKETGPGGGFTKAHCKASDAGSGNFSHVAINQDTTTHITATNEKTNAETNGSTPQKLKATVNGITVELSATGIHGEGGLTNKIEPTGEHYVHGHEVKLVYTGVTVALPTGKGCKVYTDPGGGAMGPEGTVATEPLTVTSTGQGDSLKLEPENVGKVFAKFWITECKGSEALEGLNKTYEVTGSLTCKPDGATLTCDHTEVTTQGNLKLNGSIKAGYSGTTTIKGGHTEGGTNPLSVTTVETP
jgi:hypothetical protein